MSYTDPLADFENPANVDEVCEMLFEVAATLLPAIIAESPRLAASDASELALEGAAALMLKTLQLRAGVDADIGYAAEFWRKHRALLP